MSNLESEFKKELKKELGVYGAKDIYKIPLPDSASKVLICIIYRILKISTTAS